MPAHATDKWWVWGSAALLVAWIVGYACAAHAYDVAGLALLLLAFTAVETAHHVRLLIFTTVQRALRPWRRVEVEQ